MNKKYLIKIPVKTEKTLTNGTKVLDTSNSIDLNINTMLNPFYLSESALLALFVDENEENVSKFYNKAREIIFYASLRAEEYCYNKIRNFNEEFKLILKRELALCFALNAFAKFFYKGYTDSIYRSKTLSEFTVTTSVKNNPLMLKDFIANSNSCLEEAKKAIDDAALMSNALGQSFTKGKLNPSNAFTYRLWFHNNLPARSNAIFASEKLWFQGNRYKGGKYVSDSRIEDRRRATRSSIY